MFLEAANAMAFELAETGRSKDEAAEWIFRKILTREPTDAELREIVGYHDTQMERLTQGELDPDEISGKPGSSPETAAWAMVARSLLNLDEAVIYLFMAGAPSQLELFDPKPKLAELDGKPISSTTPRRSCSSAPAAPFPVARRWARG